MRPAEERLAGRPALDELDDAFSLLRRCPAGVLTLYYVGTLPYVLTFLFFWAEMSTSAFAHLHLLPWSLALAAAFLWGKTGQAIFSAHLLALAAGRELPPWTLRRLWRVAQAQATQQWSAFFGLPLAALITLPFGYVYAFYHNYGILCLDAREEPQESPALRREAWKEACRWPRQNHYSLAVLLLFGLIILANILIGLFVLPLLIRMFFGVESAFSRSTWSMLNTTLFASAVAITHLIFDPFIRSFYALRCFRGRALSTGEDLLVQIRSYAPSKSRSLTAATLLALVAQGCFAAPPLAAQSAPAPTSPAPHSRAVSADELQRALASVSQRPEFAWRIPRRPGAEQEKGAVQGFFDGVFAWLKKGYDRVKGWVEDFFQWLAQRFSRSGRSTKAPRGQGFVAALPAATWAAAGLAAVVLIFLVLRARRRRRPRPTAAAPAVAAPVPDLSAEDVHADALPEEGWQQLAREMLERGETRLAIRAIYLASLAHLGEREAIALARHKTNRDYQQELRRRRPGQAELQQLFGGLVGTFERAWYGMHTATREMAEACQAQLQRIQQSQSSLPI